MKILSIIKISKTKNKIVTDDDTDFVLYLNETERLGLKEGEDISKEVWDRIFKDILPKRALARCNHLLASSERTEYQIRRSLCNSGYPDEVIDNTMDHLKEHGYIDDERYAHRYIEYAQDKRSVNMIRLDLKKRGISREIIESCMEDDEVFCQSEDAQRRAILKAISLKWKSSFAPTYQQKQKLKAFLARKGYAMSLINSTVREYFEDFDEPDDEI